jgi:hypothetical protein
MPRAYGKINEDMHLIAPAIEEAGYKVATFGSIAWIEGDGTRFVQFGCVRMGKPFTEWYKVPGDEWVAMALADLDAGKFGAR